jgi:SfnB family sulfur acquisition oxidoreductase
MTELKNLQNAPSENPVHARPKLTPPAHILTCDEDAIFRARELAAEFLTGSSQRDAQRILPFDELDRFSQSGLWGMNIPQAYGGPALSYRTVAEIFKIISAADASIGQIAQNHVSLLDVMRFDPNEQRKRHYYGAALNGFRFGNALSERGGKNIFDFKTKLVREGDHFVLDGEKFYSTGALFAHIVPVQAINESGNGVMVMVPRDAQGLSVIDDWSGFGQRTTASGTVRLNSIKVEESQIIPSHLAFDTPSVHGAVAQIIQAAIDAGIAQQAIEDTIAFVRDHARPWVDSGRDHAYEDPYTIEAIADLKIRLHAAEAVLEEAGETIDASQKNETEDSVAKASIAVAEAKILTTEIALLASTKLFELSGTRSVLESLNLNRHWRNARTHTLHDPVRWKFHAIGNYVLNDIKPPRHSWL